MTKIEKKNQAKIRITITSNKLTEELAYYKLLNTQITKIAKVFKNRLKNNYHNHKQAKLGISK